MKVVASDSWSPHAHLSPLQILLILFLLSPVVACPGCIGAAIATGAAVAAEVADVAVDAAAVAGDVDVAAAQAGGLLKRKAKVICGAQRAIVEECWSE